MHGEMKEWMDEWMHGSTDLLFDEWHIGAVLTDHELLTQISDSCVVTNEPYLHRL